MLFAKMVESITSVGKRVLAAYAVVGVVNMYLFKKNFDAIIPLILEKCSQQLRVDAKKKVEYIENVKLLGSIPTILCAGLFWPETLLFNVMLHNNRANLQFNVDENMQLDRLEFNLALNSRITFYKLDDEDEDDEGEHDE